MTRKPLVFIPGSMCDERLFAFQVEALGDVADPFVARIDGAETVAELGRSILRECPFERFHLAGLSMGGIVAMEILRQAPDRILTLALLDTNHRAELPERQARRGVDIDRAMRGELGDMLRDEIAPSCLGPRARQDEALLELVVDMGRRLGPQAFVRQQRALRDRPDSTATLRGFDGPALVLCGADDALCPVSRHEEMAGLLPASRLAVIDRAGHLTPLETPERVAAELRLWLEETT